MDPLRVLLVSRVFWPNLGGIEKHVQWLGEHLLRRGHRVRVLTLDRSFEDGSPYPPEGEIHGLPIRRVPFWGSTRYPIAPWVLRELGDADVIHVHAVDFLADWLVATRPLHRRPVVLSTHGGFFHTAHARRLKQVWFQTATRALLRAVDAVIYTSDQDEALFRRVTDRGRVIRQGVSMEPWAGLTPAPEPGRWVTVGRVDVHKGVAHLLRALAVVRDLDPRPFHARVIGPEVVPGLLATLAAERARLGLDDRVGFAGKLDDAALAEALRTAELGLWPSEYEGFGISVVESMAAGVVPVLNDIAAFRLFHLPGRTELVDFADPAAAAAAIRRARDHGAEAVAAVRAHARTFAWERVVVEVEAVYREVIARRRGGRGQ